MQLSPSVTMLACFNWKNKKEAFPKTKDVNDSWGGGKFARFDRSEGLSAFDHRAGDVLQKGLHGLLRASSALTRYIYLMASAHVPRNFTPLSS